MIVTGSLRHPIYTQTGTCYFSADLSFSNPTGQMVFGFSGHNNQTYFSFTNGKIFDWRNNLIGFYNNVDSLNLSGNINTGTVDYYLNSEPIAFGVHRTTGHISGIYARVTNQTVNMELNVNGGRPDYLISGSVFNTGSTTTPYTIFNYSSLPFRIFSGTLVGNTTRFSLQTIPTGYVQNSLTFNLLTSGQLSLGSGLISLDLYTDFGLEHTKFTVSGSGIA